MTLTKVLWASLTGCIGVIVLMASAWAHETTERSVEFDRRININEQHYASIDAQLQDVREQLKELKGLVRENRR